MGLLEQRHFSNLEFKNFNKLPFKNTDSLYIRSVLHFVRRKNRENFLKVVEEQYVSRPHNQTLKENND